MVPSTSSLGGVGSKPSSTFFPRRSTCLPPINGCSTNLIYPTSEILYRVPTLIKKKTSTRIHNPDLNETRQNPQTNRSNPAVIGISTLSTHSLPRVCHSLAPLLRIQWTIFLLIKRTTTGSHFAKPTSKRESRGVGKMAPNARISRAQFQAKLPHFLLVLLLSLSSSSGYGHDYSDALRKSILFFEGQRSGPLPPDQRIRWRRDSALRDGATAGVNPSTTS